MKYYRVKESFDNTNYYRNMIYRGFLIGGELLTPAEYKAISDCYILRPVKSNIKPCFEVVEISQRNIYKSFGARFECRKDNDYDTLF